MLLINFVQSQIAQDHIDTCFYKNGNFAGQNCETNYRGMSYLFNVSDKLSKKLFSVHSYKKIAISGQYLHNKQQFYYIVKF